tara:strand:+ start:537 stop:1613 length:1077 start_codon:yes stop_codon:yes gene_type:complete
LRYYIITGEPSGDMHAANLVSELKSVDDNSVIRAWGGERLISEGIEISKNIKDISFMGIWSVLINIGTIKSNLHYCKKDLLAFKADVLILVDYPGFNLKIAEFAKKNKIKVFYYISPKVWAWNKKRIYKIKKYVDHLLVIFPFEVEFYKQHGVEVTYVGNPLLDEIKKKNLSFSSKHSKLVIALLPGSRKQEIDKILPKMLSIVADFHEYQFVIAGNKNFDQDYYNKFIKDDNVSLVYDQTYGLLENSKYALVTSGTATLEAALFKVPQVVCYRTNWLTYFIGRLLVKIPYLSLVNILMDRMVVKELVQSELTKDNLTLEIHLMIKNQENIIRDYKKIINLLDKKGASKNAARFIFRN